MPGPRAYSRPDKPRTPAAVAAATEFARWCDDTNDQLLNTALVDLTTVAERWRTEAARSRIHGRTWQADIFLMAVGLITAIATVLALGYDPLFGLAAAGAAVGGLAGHLWSLLNPRLLVGPSAPRGGPIWFPDT